MRAIVQFFETSHKMDDDALCNFILQKFIIFVFLFKGFGVIVQFFGPLQKKDDQIIPTLEVEGQEYRSVSICGLIF